MDAWLGLAHAFEDGKSERNWAAVFLEHDIPRRNDFRVYSIPKMLWHLYRMYRDTVDQFAGFLAFVGCILPFFSSI